MRRIRMALTWIAVLMGEDLSCSTFFFNQGNFVLEASWLRMERLPGRKRPLQLGNGGSMSTLCSADYDELVNAAIL